MQLAPHSTYDTLLVSLPTVSVPLVTRSLGGATADLGVGLDLEVAGAGVSGGLGEGVGVGTGEAGPGVILVGLGEGVGVGTGEVGPGVILGGLGDGVGVGTGKDRTSDVPPHTSNSQTTGMTSITLAMVPKFLAEPLLPLACVPCRLLV